MDLQLRLLDMNNCNHQTFFDDSMSPDQKCQVALTDCLTEVYIFFTPKYQFISFFRINFCLLDGHWEYMLIISIIIVYFVFKFLSNVVEEYLAPSIAFITETIHFSESLAAVTLLALANGAGDVVTALVASSTDGGIKYNIGSLYGAGLFVMTVVVGITIMNATDDQLIIPRVSIIRDLGMYLIATVTILVFALLGELNFYAPIIMFSEYLLLILIVYLQEKYESTQSEIEMNPMIKGSVHPVGEVDDKRLKSNQRWKGLMLRRKVVSIWHRVYKNAHEHHTQFSEMTIPQKVDFIFDYPFKIMRRFTMPPVEPEKWTHFYGVIWPILGLPFVYYVIFWKINWWILVVPPLSIALTITLYSTSDNNGPPKYYIYLQIYAAICSLFWTYLVSGILIDLLQFLGVLGQVDKTYLGLTIIAIGNALPDSITTISLASQGHAVMGITGAYAGQLFGLLVGFGTSLFKKTIFQGTQNFSLFDLSQLKVNITDLLVIFTTITTLTITIGYSLLHQSKLKQGLSIILFMIYATFMTGASAIATIQMLQ